MDTNQFKIKIYNTIADDALKKAWIELQAATEAFPQMHYEWVASWWKLNNTSRKLYIITVVDSEQKTVGIAPFCIEKQFGLKTLQSIPVHFGDYFNFLISPSFEVIVEMILKHLNSFKHWSYVKINLVRQDVNLFYSLQAFDYKKQQLERIIQANIKDSTFEEYLMMLNTKVRGEYRRRLRKLNELGDVKLVVSSNPEVYESNEKKFREIYEKRWNEIDKKMPGDNVYQYRKEALTALAKEKKASFVLLLLNEQVIAYRFGILHNKTYSDYKLSFDPDYGKYGLGSIITGLLIENLIQQDYAILDHGVGEYSYKWDWSPKGKAVEIYAFHQFKKSLLPQMIYKFHTSYKEKIKTILDKYVKR